MELPFPIEAIIAETDSMYDLYRIKFKTFSKVCIYVDIPSEYLQFPDLIASKFKECHDVLIDQFVKNAPLKKASQVVKSLKSGGYLEYTLEDTKYLQYMYGLNKIHEASTFEWNIWVEDHFEKMISHAPDFKWFNYLNQPDKNLGSIVSSTLRKLIPNIESDAACFKCSVTGSVRSVIIHLNDHHKLTREELADWLETLDVDLSFN